MNAKNYVQKAEKKGIDPRIFRFLTLKNATKIVGEETGYNSLR